METSKTSPFSQFDQWYYSALRRISFAQAEAYRQEVVKWQAHTIDLWQSLGKINEAQALWLEKVNPDQEKIDQEIYEQRHVAAGTIDLAAKYENGGVVPQDMHTIQSKNIEKEMQEKKSIDLSKLIESPEELTEEMVEEAIWVSTSAEEATNAVIDDALQDEVITTEDIEEQVEDQSIMLLRDTLQSGFNTESVWQAETTTEETTTEEVELLNESKQLNDEELPFELPTEEVAPKTAKKTR